MGLGLGVEIDQPSGAAELNWTHLDRLGSVVAISDAAGVLKEKLAYDSWASAAHSMVERRLMNWTA